MKKSSKSDFTVEELQTQFPETSEKDIQNVFETLVEDHRGYNSTNSFSLYRW